MVPMPHGAGTWAATTGVRRNDASASRVVRVWLSWWQVSWATMTSTADIVRAISAPKRTAGSSRSHWGVSTRSATVRRCDAEVRVSHAPTGSSGNTDGTSTTSQPDASRRSTAAWQTAATAGSTGA